MSASNALETGLLNLILNNAALANIGDASGLQPSTADGNLYLSLHTADPGEGGNQESNETAYTSYARVAVARDGTGWNVSGNTATLAADAPFPACTGGTATITHFGLGTASSGAGVLLFSGTVTPNLSVSTGVTPQLDDTTTITAD